MENKKKAPYFKNSLNELVKKFSKNDVIAEMEKEYQHSASKSIPLALIDDNRFVKKVVFPPSKMERFAATIAEKGLYNPLIVRSSGTHYELIIGRKRYFGAKRVHLKEVPCVIVDAGDEETLLMLLADTRDQREGNVVEMALLYEALSSRFHYSPLTLANLSHESRSQVANSMRILNLPDNVISEVCLGELSYGHARAMASLSQEEIEEVVKKIHQDNLSVREVEQLARQYNGAPVEKESNSTILEKQFKANSVLNRKTSIVFSFASEDDKNAFIERIKQK
jgi:ParB family chromosome partitioning protein